MRLTAISVCFRRGSSSSSTSVGSLRMNLPSAIKPNACDPALTPTSNAGSARKLRRLPCIVVKPYTGSMREHNASRIVLVASRTCCHIRDQKKIVKGDDPHQWCCNTALSTAQRKVLLLSLRGKRFGCLEFPTRQSGHIPVVQHPTRL